MVFGRATGQQQTNVGKTCAAHKNTSNKSTKSNKTSNMVTIANNDNNKKSVAVIGSTGKQGGGLVRAMLEDVDSRFVTVSTLSFLHARKLREPCRKQDCRVGSPVPGSRAVEFSWLPVGGARPACGVQACVARS